MKCNNKHTIMKGSTNGIRVWIDYSFIHTGGIIANQDLIFICERFVHPRLWLRNPNRYIFNVNMRLKVDLQNVNLSVFEFMHNGVTKLFRFRSETAALFQEYYYLQPGRLFNIRSEMVSWDHSWMGMSRSKFFQIILENRRRRW